MSLAAIALAAGSAGAIDDAKGTTDTAGRTAASLDLHGFLAVDSLVADCPAGVPADADCRARTGRGMFRGLGSVTATYLWYFTASGGNCPSDLAKPFATSAQIVVAGKGEIRLAISPGERCVDIEPVRNEPQTFTVSGGSGEYEGATGSGRLERSLSGGRGTETLSGVLTVPGRDFDLAPPTFTGAKARTVRAAKGVNRTRVTYTVAAKDTVDGILAAMCAPKSGTRFPLGRTMVTCEATDKSANTARVRFAVTVRKSAAG